MSHVVTERCVDCRYTDCCAVCPVECFWEVKNPAMLVIDPAVCIDCGLCIPECPIYAIYPLDEVPEPYKEWIQKNAQLAPTGKQITAKTESLPTAIPLDKIHEKEKSRGWKVPDPSAVGGASVSGATAKKTEAKPVKKEEAPAAGAVPATPQDQAAAILQKKLQQAGRTPAAAPATGPAGYRPVPLKLPKTPLRPPLGVNIGGKIRMHHRTGAILDMRKALGGGYSDVKVLFEGDDKATWYVYSSLQAYKEKGDLEVVDAGPKPNLLKRLFKV